MAKKHSLEWVLPQALKSLKLNRSILDSTEGISFEDLAQLDEVIQSLEALAHDNRFFLEFPSCQTN